MIRNTHTHDIVSYFLAGLTIDELMLKTGLPRATIENALRRYMVVYAVGRRAA